MRQALRAGVLLMVLFAAVAAAHAAAARDPKEEAAFASGLAMVDPSLAKRFHAGTAALDAGRLAEARAEFQAIVDRAPNHAPTLRRLARVESLQKRAPEAIALARRALAAEPGAYGQLTLALVLAASGDSSAREEARTLAAAADTARPDEASAALRAELAVEASDHLALAEAVQDLRKRAPEGVAASYFGALLSLLRNEASEADRLLTLAERAGLPAAEAARLREQTGLGRHLRIRAIATATGLGFLAWGLGLVGFYVLGRALSGKTLSAIEVAAGDYEALKGRTQALRRFYATVIGAAAAYYYLSIPFVIVLVLVGAAAVVLAFLAIGWIPVYLVLAVCIGALFSVWTMLRSLVAARAPEKDPGRKLTEDEAPRLWATLREVAGKVGTRPVDAVYLTPGTDMGVAERGPLRARLADRGHRYLVLGVGVLPGFSQASLRAVLAHEYGHFSHRDTAGGGMAMAVLGALTRTVVALANRGGMVMLNPAWQFLRAFCALFMRITLGASRLQEVIADHFAALAYGPRAFAEGLRHVIRRSVEFGRQTEHLVAIAEKERRPVANLYQLPDDAPLPVENDGAEALAQALEGPGSPYDSHPPPRQRLAWIARLPEPAGEPSPDGAAWDLFARRDQLEVEMTALLNDELERAGVIDVPEPPPFVPPPSGPPAD